MSKTGLPLSRRLLDMAIERLSSRFGEAQGIRRAVASHRSPAETLAGHA